MTSAGAYVNRRAERMLRTELTLSEVPELAHDLSGDPSAPARPSQAAPPEAILRDERDPYVWTEAELRLAWGDR